MSNLHVKYVLVGGGLASSSAAEAIREIDPRSAMLIVGQENARPYNRPPLSKEFLRGEKKHDELFTHPAGWFAEKHIDLRTGRRASHLDASRHIVTLDDGEEISFDKLLIATGASPKHLTCPGADLPSLYYVRTFQDIDRIQNAVAQATREGSGRVVVIGAGVLGVELAASLTQMGLKVDLVCSGPWVWTKFSGESTGKCVGMFLNKHGVTVHEAARVERLEGDGRVQRVVLSGGKVLGCHFAVASIGMVVNKELLRGTSIAAEKAILVDAHGQTSEKDVYAAGDCAAIFDPLFGKHRVLDHWDNAIVTGKLAGRNMAGADDAYDAVNYFFSDVFELSLSAWGESRHVGRRLIRGNVNVDRPDFVEIGVGEDGKIRQVLAVGHAGEDDTLKALVKQRVMIDGNEEAIKDPTFALADLVK
jgi:3-phenylpropionate/trans-cinnamate dioxygenase ferredoxin reductase subunit